MGGNSLVYRVLKARYFPTCDFIHASIGNNPSYTWRSLIFAQSLVNEGLRWRVGNGANIKVWQDKWLPWGSTYRVTSPRLFLSLDTRVADLIDPHTTRWKNEVLDGLFLSYEADLTKSIPLSATLLADKVVWAVTNNGKFTVRSAYKLVVSMFKSKGHGTTFDGTLLRRFWKKVWSLPIPHKAAWAASKLNLLPPDANAVTFQDLLWHELMIADAGDMKSSQLVMIAWKLWCNRNEIYHGEKHDSTASDLVQPFDDRKNDVQHSDWVPSPSGLCKINVDGAFFPTKKLAGIGVVIRDQQGRLFAALCRKIRAQMGVLEIEAKAYEAGILFARHLGLKNGVLEGDSLIVSNALKQAAQPPTSVAAIVEGINVLSSDVGVVAYSHVRRTGNKPAHILARQAQSFVNDVIWIEEIPCCIQQALAHDVLGS
ncbi:hypothetical protein SO802_005872 [Lithocarpus litseifolius]|uniref:RNase H type-1 domain-containing protein n=1 Tax=Lithocarpus litseifolius TaxID=425828 RepID=A0AAW2DML3_9ROSI